MHTIGLVILAAGASTRLGTPKQLLRYQGQTLLRRAAEMALAASCRPVIVVLGAYADSLCAELQGLPVRIVENREWEQGMGSSICAGVKELLALSETEPEPEAVLFMLCDQPLVSAQLLNRLIETHRETGRLIVASEYDQTLGVPALFHRSLFSELSRLKGTEGAKQILQRYPAQTLGVPFPEGSVDIDTPADYKRLGESY